ncbi:hypothetical protein HK102_004134 [Quaeritorhiza haematococci]|nr:hypothetical protein HK102_004134 [Quaeritorhiza haematococci]
MTPPAEGAHPLAYKLPYIKDVPWDKVYGVNQKYIRTLFKRKVCAGLAKDGQTLQQTLTHMDSGSNKPHYKFAQMSAECWTLMMEFLDKITKKKTGASQADVEPKNKKSKASREGSRPAGVQKIEPSVMAKLYPLDGFDLKRCLTPLLSGALKLAKLGAAIQRYTREAWIRLHIKCQTKLDYSDWQANKDKFVEAYRLEGEKTVDEVLDAIRRKMERDYKTKFPSGQGSSSIHNSTDL